MLGLSKSFLKGHSYTYEGATYGKICESLIKTGIMNPLLLFDELAKTKTVKLNWNYDEGDTDMLQTGNRLEKITSLKFNYKEI